MNFSVRTILLDIEGTTSSISFVHDVMFGYVRSHLASFLAQHHGSPELQHVLDQMAHDANRDPHTWLPSNREQAIQHLHQHVIECMDRDQKSTGLKSLQGWIWRHGFHSATLQAHLFPEVASCLRSWKASGFDLRIYSSGSCEAQKLFFGHTLEGDLLPLLTAHYDTTVGSKRDANSYRRIIQDVGLPPPKILFLSDIYEELVAAQQAGMSVAASVRPGNAPLPTNCPFVRFEDMSNLAITLADA